MPEQLARQIDWSRQDVAAVRRPGRIDGGTVIARGVDYCTAFETALKIREMSGLLVEAWSAADLMHGPVAAIGPGWPVFAIAPTGPALAAVVEGIDAVLARGARLVTISDDEELLARGEVGLRLIAGLPEWLSPLVAVVPGSSPPCSSRSYAASISIIRSGWQRSR